MLKQPIYHTDSYFVLTPFYRQDLQNLLDFFYSLFPDETKNTQSPPAK
jgi:hypothetical protein